MLALPTSPPLVSASAVRPFRTALEETVDGVSKECEVVRALMRGESGTVELAEAAREVELLGERTILMSCVALFPPMP